MEKLELKEREAKIIEMAVAFCNEHLDKKWLCKRKTHVSHQKRHREHSKSL